MNKYIVIDLEDEETTLCSSLEQVNDEVDNILVKQGISDLEEIKEHLNRYIEVYGYNNRTGLELLNFEIETVVKYGDA